jgi:GAF domain-containing protein
MNASGKTDASLSRVRYAFVHDRVLQAAYSLATEEQHKKLHLQIGRHLRARVVGDPRDEDIIDIVHHMNRGAEGISEAAERLELVRLNWRAGRRAKASTAYHAGAEYLRAGMAQLREEDWANHYKLCYDVHYEAAECETFRGDFERASAIMEALLKRARNDLDRVKVMRLRIVSLSNVARFGEALALGADALRLLGHPLEVDEFLSPQVMFAELGKIDEALKGRRILDLVDAPEIKEERLRAVLTILDSLAGPAFMHGQIAFGVLNFRTANFCIEHGNNEISAFPYSSVGYTLSGIILRVADGRDFNKLALEVNKKFPSSVAAARLSVPYASSMQLYAPLREATPHYIAGRQKAIEAGDFLILASASFLQLIGHVIAGDQLEEILEEADKIVAICRRSRDLWAITSVTAARQAIACLAGKTKGDISFSDDNYDEERDIVGLPDLYFPLPKCHHYFLKTLVCLIHGKYPEALEFADITEQRRAVIGGNPAAQTHPFLHSLAILGSARSDDPAEMKRRSELLEKHGAEIEQLANWAPYNFGHMKLLVDAEKARVSGDMENTIRLYERAIALAQENKAPHFEAMANEMAAKFFLSLGAATGGLGYIRNAYRGFRHWGAASKVAAMEEHTVQAWPSLREITRTRPGQTRPGEITRSHATRTLLEHTNIGGIRDAALVVRAAQEIASEIDLPRVIDRLAKLVLENAGADHGALVLARDGELYVAAKLGSDSSQLDEGKGQALSESNACARSIVLYVARTQETVVIDNTQRVHRFAEDPYLASGLAKAILVLPLLHQGRLSGVLYLENRSAVGVFNAARVELLTLLSSQAAIAIDIARLIENARAANEEVRRTNERLEQEVMHRTEELRNANENLFMANQRLEQELLQRLEVEEQRASLNAQMLAAQKERLAELSTPLLPISKDIVVIPLIGSMDTERAEQVLAVALDGAQRLGSRVVILDVTGLKHVDTHTAGMLGNVAAALRLLGSETVITGIRPKIAQTLIALDINLHTFVTMATLQSGMEYALARTRGRSKAH